MRTKILLFVISSCIVSLKQGYSQCSIFENIAVALSCGQTFSEYTGAYLVKLQHTDGSTTLYAHMKKIHLVICH